GEERALEIQVRAAQAEMQRVGDVAVAVVPGAGAQAPVEAVLLEDALALQLPLELEPVVGDQHVVLDVLGAGRNEVAQVAAIGAALALFRTGELHLRAEKCRYRPGLLEAGGNGLNDARRAIVEVGMRLAQPDAR